MVEYGNTQPCVYVRLYNVAVGEQTEVRDIKLLSSVRLHTYVIRSPAISNAFIRRSHQVR